MKIYLTEEGKRNSKIVSHKALMMSIIGRVDNQEAADRIIQMLMDADMDRIEADTCPNFEVWLEDLPEEPVDGLADACWSWIHSWGNGGGDYSTETCIESAITELGSNSPRALADAIFHSVVDYSKGPFEASCLTRDLIEEAMRECEYANRKGENA